MPKCVSKQKMKKPLYAELDTDLSDETSSKTTQKIVLDLDDDEDVSPNTKQMRVKSCLLWAPSHAHTFHSRFLISSNPNDRVKMIVDDMSTRCIGLL